MAQTKRTRKPADQDFVPMERTRALLKQLWEHWRTNLDHTPDMARRMMTAAIDEMHKTETAGMKKANAVVAKAKGAVKKDIAAGKNKLVKTKPAKKLKAVKKALKAR